MAIKTRELSKECDHEMTFEEFKRWLKKFNCDRDGRISREELQDTVRFTGGWFLTGKHRRAVNDTEADGNGFINEKEMNNLVEFAQRMLGVKRSILKRVLGHYQFSTCFYCLISGLKTPKLKTSLLIDENIILSL